MQGGAVMKSIRCRVSPLLGALVAVVAVVKWARDTSGRWRMTPWTPADSAAS